MIVFFKKKLKLLLNRYKFVRGNINYNDRKGALHKAWGYVFSNYSMGDYVEFGVCKGDSFKKKFDLFSGIDFREGVSLMIPSIPISI